MHQSRAIAEYSEEVERLDEELYQKFWEDAKAYNLTLIGKANRFTMSEEEREEYEGLLDISGSGIIGYVEIPAIDCKLPIYHGSDEAVLQIAVGHIEGSSLPVGGAGTHCVLSGHRGLPSAKLFSNLDKLEIGDTFMLKVLDETLTYEVDQILVVEPDETEALAIEEGEDYCTLITCTPYGINTHRLLVRGHRVPNQEDRSAAGGDRRVANLWPVISLAAVMALMLLLVLLLVRGRKRKGGK